MKILLNERRAEWLKGADGASVHHGCCLNSVTFETSSSDLMTEMMDMSSDLVGSGIPFLDYRMYAERIFFPGHRESPLRRDLDVQECRRQTVEQGLVQLSNLLNSKLFLTKVLIIVMASGEKWMVR